MTDTALPPGVTSARLRATQNLSHRDEWMDLVAAQYDLNDGAMGRFTTRIKAALDPEGLLSPGKQGIWPAGSPWSQSKQTVPVP